MIKPYVYLLPTHPKMWSIEVYNEPFSYMKYRHYKKDNFKNVK